VRREWDLSDSEARADLLAWLGEHGPDGCLEVTLPFMRWLYQRPPSEMRKAGETLIALADLAERLDATRFVRDHYEDAEPES
jgi:hypothetical protein